MNASDFFTITDDVQNGWTLTFSWHNVEDVVLDGKLIHVVCRTCCKVFHFSTEERAEEVYRRITWQSQKI